MVVVMTKHCVLVCLCWCMEERGISRRLELCPSTKWAPSAPIGGLASNQVATNGIWGMRPSPLKSPRISHISCFFIASAPEARIFTQLFFTQTIFTRIFWAFTLVQTGILYEPRERERERSFVLYLVGPKAWRRTWNVLQEDKNFQRLRGTSIGGFFIE